MPIVRVVEALGYPVKRNGSAFYTRCPAQAHEHDDEDPKCSLGGNGKSVWHCFKCGEKGDAVGFVKAARGCGAPEAFAWLRDQFNLPGPKEPTQHRHKDGLHELAALRGWTPDALQAIGAFPRGECVVFPMLDHKGSVVGHKRRLGDNTAFKNGAKSLTNRGGRNGLFCPTPFPSDGVVLVVEGETDTVAAISAGHEAVVGTAGATPGPIGNTALQHLLPGRECVLVPDPGEPGRAWLGHVGELLANAQCVVRFAPNDGQHDLDEFLRHADDRAGLLRELVDEALPWRAGCADGGSAGLSGIIVAAQALIPGVYELTDMGNAERLVATYAKDIRYCDPWGTWLVWDGRRYKRDDTREIYRLGMSAVRAIYLEASACKDDKLRPQTADHARRSESARALGAMLNDAKSLVPVTPQDLDRSPWLLNVVNGTVDLEQGEFREHRQEDLLTMLAPVEYNEDAECPRWRQFLDEIFGGDTELIAFVQRFLGASLTGDVSQQVLPIFWGDGANGKSTLLDTVLGLMGDYAGKAPPDLLVSTKHDRHPTEIADLKGRRFVVSSETEDGRRLRTQRVKELTGDSTLKGRFMHGDFFEFQRTQKMVLVTNNKPVIREMSHAMWRRIRLVPFAVVIPDEKQDLGLLDKLRQERPGILNWLLDGTRAWLRDKKRLPMPKAVEDATAEYKQEENPLQDFIDERCEVLKSGYEAHDRLWKEYKQWADDHRIRYPIGKRQFTGHLRALGYEGGRAYVNGKQVRVVHGLGLSRDDIELGL